MLSAAIHLLSRSFFAMVSAFSSNALGFLSGIVLLLLVWGFHVGSKFRKSKKIGFWPRIYDAVIASNHLVKAEFAAFFCLWLVAWFVFVIRTIYYDHTGLRWSYRQDKVKISSLKSDLDRRLHIIDPTDPVFSDLDHLMTAFRVFKNDTHGESCVVRITAPQSSERYGRMIAIFSIAVDNCPTFGPMPVVTDPDEVADTVNGMIPDAIIFHASRDDRAANALFNELGNQVRLIRSYDLGRPNYQIPPGGYKHVVWLQIGSNVKWNSEIY